MGAKKNEEGSLQGWEIPPSSAPPREDPWKGPGHSVPLANTHDVNPRVPFRCRLCGLGMTAREANAYDGEMYCLACQPPGAVSGAHDLPNVPLLTRSDPDDDQASHLISNPILRGLFRFIGTVLEMFTED